MYPFGDNDFHSVSRNIIDEITAEIQSLKNDYVLKASPIELEQYYVEKARIDPLVLNVENRYIKDQTGVQIDVSHDIRRALLHKKR